MIHLSPHMHCDANTQAQSQPTAQCATESESLPLTALEDGTRHTRPAERSPSATVPHTNLVDQMAVCAKAGKTQPFFMLASRVSGPVERKRCRHPPDPTRQGRGPATHRDELYEMPQRGCTGPACPSPAPGVPEGPLITTSLWNRPLGQLPSSHREVQNDATVARASSAYSGRAGTLTMSHHPAYGPSNKHFLVSGPSRLPECGRAHSGF